MRVGLIDPSPASSLKQLPSRWRWVRLGEVCLPVKKVDPKSLDQDRFNYIDISAVSAAEKKVINPHTVFVNEAPSRARQLVRCGDVIVSTTRPYLNAVATIDRELDRAVCSTGFCVLRPGPEITSDILFFLVQHPSFVHSLSSLTQGALYPAVTDRQVKEQTIPLPPMDEQQRIGGLLVNQMTIVERARAAVERQRVLAMEIIPSVLDKHLTNKGKRWSKRSIASCVREFRNGFGRRPRGTENGPIVLRIADVSSGVVDISAPRRVAMEDDEIWKYRLFDGEVILIRVNGSLELVGRAIPFMDCGETVCFNDHLMRARLHSGIEPEYFCYVMNHRSTRDHIEAACVTSAGQKTVNQGTFKAIDIPVPPREEQLALCRQISHMATLANGADRVVTKQGQLMDSLSTTILRSAFWGEL